MDNLDSAQRRLLRIDSLPLLSSGQKSNFTGKNYGTPFTDQRVDATPRIGHQANLAHYHNSFYSSPSSSSVVSTSQKAHRPRKSFSSLSDALNDIRSLPSRAASLRHKTLGSFKGSYHKEDNINNTIDRKSASSDFPRILNWFRRDRHPSLFKSLGIHTQASKSFSACSSVPSTEVEPVSLPRTPVGGAAARAAAAAQNEIYELSRASTTPTYLRPIESNLTNDSESGICIDIRDSLDDIEDLDNLTIRKDPIMSLPGEIVAQILSYCDVASLINASLVSRLWHHCADTEYHWKHAFYDEYGFSYPLNSRARRIIKYGGGGLGNGEPNQEWKKMWKVRKRLQKRWLTASATPIYLDGHRDTVYCVQFDENKIVTGSRDRTVRVWDARTYQCLKVLGVPKPLGPPPPDRRANTIMMNCGQRVTGPALLPQFEGPQRSAFANLYHQQSVLCLQYDDKIMVTGSSDKTCIVWDLRMDFFPKRKLFHHSAGVLDVCFNEKYIVSCSKDTTIGVWERATCELKQTLSGHRGPVNAVEIRGHLLVSASGDGVARLWNLEEGRTIREFSSKHRGMACVEFSLDSRTIFAGGNDQAIYQFDANTGELIKEFAAHAGLVRSLYLDSLNSRIVSGSYDKSVKAYDTRTGEMICDFSGWTSSWILSAKSNFRKLIATSQDGGIVVMDYGYHLPGVELLEGRPPEYPPIPFGLVCPQH